tara:strand:- start:99 stop:1100 length:1002 start_codon:yes stop_codon:yes gene_type:complete
MAGIAERLKKRWFLVSLILVFTIGVVFNEPLAGVPEMKQLRSGIVFVVLYLMALPLSLKAISSGIQRPKGTVLSIIMNYGLLPIVAYCVSLAIKDPQVSRGLLVAAVTPCTLASASVWTRKAGGNDSISILVTLLTNLLCFLIAPLWLMFYFGSGEGMENISLQDMVVKLGMLVVLPMALAQLTRLHKPTANWSTDNKKYFSMAAQCGILSMVFMGAIKVAPELIAAGTDEGVTLVLVTVTSVLAVHCSVFWIGLYTGKILKLAREDYIAVGFAGSQKTLMVGLLICMELKVLVIPMVLYHVCQLFVDTIFADRLTEETKRLSKQEGVVEASG